MERKTGGGPHREHAPPQRSRSPGRPAAEPVVSPAVQRVFQLQRTAGNSALSAWLTRFTPEQNPAPLRSGPAPALQRSVFSWAVKAGVKKATKETLSNFIETQIKAKLRLLLDKDMVKRFGREADDILAALEDPWWATAVGFLPVVGDAFDLARLPPKLRKAFDRADRLEAKVSKVLALQGRKAVDIIPGTLKRSNSYASELEHLTYGELREMASKNPKAAAMKKLIENQMRLMEKL